MISFPISLSLSFIHSFIHSFILLLVWEFHICPSQIQLTFLSLIFMPFFEQNLWSAPISIVQIILDVWPSTGTQSRATYQRLYSKRKLTFHTPAAFKYQKPLDRNGIVWPTPLCIMSFDLVWACTSLEYTDITTLHSHEPLAALLCLENTFFIVIQYFQLLFWNDTWASRGGMI